MKYFIFFFLLIGICAIACVSATYLFPQWFYKEPSPTTTAEVNTDQRTDMNFIFYRLLQEYPTKLTGRRFTGPNGKIIPEMESVIKHGQLIIRLNTTVNAYMTVSIKNENGETFVYYGGWNHQGKWIDDFYVFVKPIVDKYNQKEESVRKAEKEAERKILEAYK